MTPELYNNLYQAIHNIVQNTLDEIEIKGKIESESIADFTKDFIKQVLKSEDDSNAKEIVTSVLKSTSKLIPFSNKALYGSFISSVVSKTNSDYIRRKFTGLQAVLNPSFGMTSIYEDVDGKTYKVEDLVSLFDKDFSNVEVDKNLKSNEVIKFKVSTVLNSSKFSPKPVELNEIKPLDYIEITDESGNISFKEMISINDYYDFKQSNLTSTFRKLYSKPRDLKPVDITFVKNGLSTNIFDCQALKMKNDFTRGKSTPQLEAFINYFGLSGNNKAIIKYIDRFAQRTFEMLNSNKIFQDINESGSNIQDVFTYTDGDQVLIDNLISKFKPSAIYNNEIIISDYVHKDAENIMPKLYKTQFNLENINHANIDRTFFENKLKSLLIPQTGSKYDVMLTNHITGKNLHLILKEGNKFKIDSENNLIQTSSVKLPEVIGRRVYINTIESNGKFYRIDEGGRKMYEIPDKNTLFFKDSYGNDMMYLSTNDVKSLINSAKKLYQFVEINNHYGIDVDTEGKINAEKLVNLYKVVNSTNIINENARYLRKKGELLQEFIKSNGAFNLTQNKTSKDLQDSFINNVATMLHES